MVEARVVYDYEPQNSDELALKVGDVITDVERLPGGWWTGNLKEKHGLFPDNFVEVLTKDQNKNAEHNGVHLRKGDKKRKCRVVYSYTPVNDDELELQVDQLIDVLEEVEEGWWKGMMNGRIGVFPSNFVEDTPSATPINESRSSKESVPDGSDKSRDSGGSSGNQIKPKPVRGVGLGNIFQDEMIKLKPAQDSPVEKKASSAVPKKVGASEAPVLPPKPVREQARVLFPYDACNDDELTLKDGDIINILSKEIEDRGWWKGELNNRVGVFPDNFVELVTVPDVQVRKPDRPSINNKTGTTQNLLHAVSRCQSAIDTAESPPPIPDHPKRPDVVKKDDKPERPEKPMPPLPSKKPQLPPPMKKPQRPAAPAPPVSPGAPLPASVPVPAPSSAAVVLLVEAVTDDMKVKSQDDTSFDGVEPTTDKLTHLTATRVRNPHRRPPSHVFLKDTDVLLENEETSTKATDKPSEVERSAPTSDIRKESAPSEAERPISTHSARKEAPERPLARPPSFKAISSTETDGVPIRPKPHGLPPKPTTLSRDEGDNRLARSSEESLPVVIDLRREVQQLKSTVNSLQQTMESHKLQYTEKVKELTQEIEDEKKTRAQMQVELDRLKKLVKET